MNNSRLQEKPPTSQGRGIVQLLIKLLYFPLLWIIFAFLAPDPDYESGSRLDRIRILNTALTINGGHGLKLS
jgi:hypothetical protein